MKRERRGSARFILPPSSFALQPLRLALALLDELPEAAAPLLDQGAFVELEADVGLLARDVHRILGVELDPQLELRDLELSAAWVGRVDREVFAANLGQCR